MRKDEWDSMHNLSIMVLVYNFKGFSRTDEIFSRRVTAENVFKIFQHTGNKTIVCIFLMNKNGVANYYNKVELTSGKKKKAYIFQSTRSLILLPQQYITSGAETIRAHTQLQINTMSIVLEVEITLFLAFCYLNP